MRSLGLLWSLESSTYTKETLLQMGRFLLKQGRNYRVFFNLQTNQIVLKEGNKTGSEYAMVRGDLQFIPDFTMEDYRSHLYGEEEGEMGNRRMEIRNEEWRE